MPDLTQTQSIRLVLIDRDLVDLRRWAVETALKQPAAIWQTADIISAASQLEEYVLGAGPFGRSTSGGDRSDASSVEGEPVLFGMAAPGGGGSVAEAVNVESVGDSLNAVARDDIDSHTESSVAGVATATVGAEGGAVTVPPSCGAGGGWRVSRPNDVEMEAALLPLRLAIQFHRDCYHSCKADAARRPDSAEHFLNNAQIAERNANELTRVVEWLDGLPNA